MKLPKAVTVLELELEESQNARDKRVEELWRKLDPQGRRELDFKGLQRGLRRIDHRTLATGGAHSPWKRSDAETAVQP